MIYYRYKRLRHRRSYMNAEFYVYDYETGDQVEDEKCGCFNAFNTFNQAMKVCQKVSKKYGGRYSVTVAISSVIYENGKLMED